MVDLSIIVPVYNVEIYLERCLDSIFSQQLEESFEVIAVNDGSTDGSLVILKKYKQKHNNLIIVDQGSNKSLAVARKTGINYATGKYVIHIDSDDWVKPNMFSELLQLSKKEDYPDVIVYNYTVNDGNNDINVEMKIKTFLNANEEDKDIIQNLFFGTSVNKMTKLSVLSNILYGSEYHNTTEDLIYATEVFIKSSKIVLTPTIYYNYFVNRKSLTSTITPEKYINAQVQVYRLLELIKKKYKRRKNGSKK